MAITVSRTVKKYCYETKWCNTPDESEVDKPIVVMADVNFEDGAYSQTQQLVNVEGFVIGKVVNKAVGWQSLDPLFRLEEESSKS